MDTVEIAVGDAVAVIDADCIPLVAGRTWSLKSGYAAFQERDGERTRAVFMHRLINATPDDLETDHINGNKLDNRRCNLRSCTRAENAKNAKASGKSRFKGVSELFIKGQMYYRASIRANGQTRFLGSFRTEEDAARAYDNAARGLHGEFARLNFP